MASLNGVHIGTSGWHYKHWVGPFYPDKLPAARMLEYYAARFDTVELNNSFYRLPLESALKSWRETVSRGFCFAMKGSRFLTHMKKLKDPEPGVAKFMQRADLLGPKLGPIVFQLPPHWELNLPRLEAFLETLPRRHRYAFELRDPTWHTPDVHKVLHKYRAAFCIYELAGFRSDLTVTTDFTYIRLHGPGGPYQGSYSPEQIGAWARRIREWERDLRGIFVYFDNDQAGYAVRNAAELRERTAH
jgi:uncharacterized protein YecE (DUF72 family)